MKFVLDKSKWLRGEGGRSMLLRAEDGRMCCIGQLARQCGLDDQVLVNAGAVAFITSELPEPLSWLADESPDDDEPLVNSNEALLAYAANDDQNTTDEQKIAELRSIFARHGIELEVTDGATP